MDGRPASCSSCRQTLVSQGCGPDLPRLRDRVLLRAHTRRCAQSPKNASWTPRAASGQRTPPREPLGFSNSISTPQSRASRRPQCEAPAAAAAAAAAASLLSLVPEHKTEQLDLDFPALDTTQQAVFDLAVVGAGPAGLSVAYQVAEQGLRVCCVDPMPESLWPNNYGVWVDEFEALGLLDCLDYVWPKAVVHLDDAREKFLDRPYGRVNRRQLKTKMGQKCAAAGVQFHKAKVSGVTHSAEVSNLICADGASIDATLVLDATGFSRKLIQFDKPWNPGYQAAWGIIAEVDSHPFDLDTMVFMDWRDSHLQSDPVLQQRGIDLPTFLYAMPLSPTRIFLARWRGAGLCHVTVDAEETSLVARPAVGFDDIQERMGLRLRHLGINVKSIVEEEYCLIPMGGVLPTIPQRVLGIGGTAGMVHPSTGYMVARTLAAAPVIAESIVRQLQARGPAEGGSGEGAPSGWGPALTAEEVSAAVWQDIWPQWRKEQREFFCFGMDVLLRLDLHGNRRFFDAFFDLSPRNWHGFLSQRLTLAELIGFGLSLFAHATTPARLEIMAKGTPGLLDLVGNLVSLKVSQQQQASGR